MQLYEDFHKDTKKQIKLIDKDNFTYRVLVNILNPYLKNSKKILDIGCGAGTISLYCASFGKEVNGIDISKKGIQEAKQSAKSLNLKNVNFNVVDFPHTIPGKKFDLVICFEVLEHLEDDNAAVKKIASVLSEKGTVIVSVPSINAPLHKIGYTSGFDKRVGHLRRYDLYKLKNIFLNNKFEVIKFYEHEGVLRNFLFTNRVAGNFIRVINKFNLGVPVTLLDNILVKLLGESDIILVARKK